MAIAFGNQAVSGRGPRPSRLRLLARGRRICWPRRSCLRGRRWGRRRRRCSRRLRFGRFLRRWLFGRRLLRDRRRAGGEFNDNRIWPQSRGFPRRRDCVQFFRLGQVTVERECHRRRGIDRQRERTGGAAGLSVRHLCLGARRLGFEAHGVQRGTRLECVKTHPIGSRGARREGKCAAQNRKNSVHHVNRPTRATGRRSPVQRIGASSRACNILRPVNLSRLTIVFYLSASDSRKYGHNGGGQLREMIDDPVWPKFGDRTVAIAKVDRNDRCAGRTRGANIGI
jgi:hypothetical protein